MLEETDENRGEEQRSYINFFFRPCVLGKDLLSIEKFGLVQYVSHYLSSIWFDFDLTEFWYLLVIPDDLEDSLCILGILVGALWGLWWWGIQVVLWVCVILYINTCFMLNDKFLYAKWLVLFFCTEKFFYFNYFYILTTLIVLQSKTNEHWYWCLYFSVNVPKTVCPNNLSFERKSLFYHLNCGF